VGGGANVVFGKVKQLRAVYATASATTCWPCVFFLFSFLFFLLPGVIARASAPASVDGR
jgi:hypothetical protein